MYLEKIKQERCEKLFLDFFVQGMFSAPFAVLFKLDFALNQLFVLARPIIGAFALGTVQFY